MTKKFAVIDAPGFYRDTTEVFSAHATEAAAVREAKKHSVKLPGQPRMGSASVISSAGGFRAGEKIYADMIGSTYERVEVWLCPVHRRIDEIGQLRPLDNCVACIRVERDELKLELAKLKAVQS